MSSKSPTSKQKELARKYRKLSYIVFAPIVTILFLMCYASGRVLLGFIVASIAIELEALYSYHIGAIQPGPVAISYGIRLFDKKYLIFYTLLSLLVLGIGFLLK